MSRVVKQVSRILTCLVILLLAVPAVGRTLSPSEAWTRAAGAPQSRAAAQPMELVFTAMEAQEPTVYVFSGSESSASQGFIIAAANDVAPAVIGYSDEGTFDLETAPPALKQLIYDWSDAISREAAAGTLPFPEATEEDERAPIAPMLTTKWGQGSPFNSKCPVVGGAHAATGCVQTAFAQQMKYFRHPDRGVGAYSHTFKYNGASYTVSADFGSEPLRWDDMLDSYTPTSPQDNIDAVATLMQYLFVADQAIPNVGGTGATCPVGARALVDYFNYDEGVAYYSTKWFPGEKWNDFIYGQLVEGLPVHYAASSVRGGHAYIVDGYDKDGFFHVNWGWNGSSNGYFKFSYHSPIKQTVGTEDSGYNLGQAAYAGVRPRTPESKPANVIGLANAVGRLITDQGTYKKGEKLYMIGNYTNYGMYDQKVILGIRIVFPDRRESSIRTTIEMNFNSFGGIYSYPLDTGYYLTMDGDYEIYPLYLKDDEFVDVYSNGEPIRLHVEGDDVTVTNYRPRLDCEMVSCYPLGNNIEIGLPYEFEFEVTTNLEFVDKEFVLVLFKNGEICYEGDWCYVSADPLNPGRAIMTLEIAPGELEKGDYLVGLATYETEGMLSQVGSHRYYFPVIEPASSPVVNLSSVTFGDGSVAGTTMGKPAMVDVSNPDITVGLTCSAGIWEHTVCGVLATRAGVIFGYLGATDVMIRNGETQDILLSSNYQAKPGADVALEEGVVYKFVPYDLTTGKQIGSKSYYVKLSGVAGLESVLADGEVGVSYDRGSGTLKAKGLEGRGSVSVYNMTGTAVKSTTLENEGVVDINDLPEGCYIVAVRTGKCSRTMKFMK